MSKDREVFKFVKEADKEVDLSGDLIGQESKRLLAGERKMKIGNLTDRILKIRDIVDYEDNDGTTKRYLNVDEISNSGNITTNVRYYISPNATDTLGVARDYKTGDVINAQTMFNVIYFNQGELSSEARKGIRKAISQRRDYLRSNK